MKKGLFGTNIGYEGNMLMLIHCKKNSLQTRVMSMYKSYDILYSITVTKVHTASGKQLFYMAPPAQRSVKEKHFWEEWG
jgi:hypothetical protein